MSESTPYMLDSAANALRVITLLGQRGTVTVTEVSTELGIGKSTAHRLLSTLVAEDFATRDPVHRKYHAGRALVGAGLSLLGDFDVRKRARAPMRQLTQRTGETTKMLILEGPYARVLELVETDQSLRVGGSIGQLLPANATAGGKLLLSSQSEEELRERFGRRLPSLTEHTVTDWDELMVELQAIRRRGWAVNVDESSAGVTGLAVPIQGQAVKTIAVLTLAAPSERLPRGRHQHVLAMMFEAAEKMRHGTSQRGRRPTAE